MKKIVLSKQTNRILWLAFRNKQFLRALLKNPKKASTAVRIGLTSDELRIIKSLLAADISLKGRELLGLVNAAHNGAGVGSAAAKVPPKPPPPPPPWKLIITMRSRGV